MTLKLSLFPLEKLRVLHAQVLILKLEVFKKLFNALSLCLLLLVSQHKHFVLIFKTIHFLSEETNSVLEFLAIRIPVLVLFDTFEIA